MLTPRALLVAKLLEHGDFFVIGRCVASSFVTMFDVLARRADCDMAGRTCEDIVLYSPTYCTQLVGGGREDLSTLACALLYVWLLIEAWVHRTSRYFDKSLSAASDTGCWWPL